MYILTVMSNFPEYVESFPLVDEEATAGGEGSGGNCDLRYGTPLRYSRTKEEISMGMLVCRLLDVGKVRTSSYHPQSNELIGRYHRHMQTTS